MRGTKQPPLASLQGTGTLVRNGSGDGSGVGFGGRWVQEGGFRRVWWLKKGV